MTEKTFAVTGATGMIGRALCQQLRARGDRVIVFSRNPDQARRLVPGCQDYQLWKPGVVPDLGGVNGVINLAGAPVLGARWNVAYQQEILLSRVESTRNLVAALKQMTPPPVLVSVSAIGYYGFRDDTKLTEEAPNGTDFLAQVCQQWEKEARTAPGRTVILRLGIVLDAKEGALAKMLPPFQNFVGGPLGSGQQWFSWVHLADVVGSILYALDTPQLQGTYNCTAPEPQTMTDFCRTLGQTIQRPSWAPVPRFALEALLGAGAVILVEGQRVLPTRLLQAGYRFQYPTSAQALANILGSASA
jgi:uncharacterized protein (TIGR01777 family)